MKARTIVVLTAVLLVSISLSFAGDQKPFKGWIQAIGDPDYNVNPLDYSYLAAVIQQRGSPDSAQIQLFRGVNNVGGASRHENVQIFYLDNYPIIDFYEYSVITVANGDQIFVDIEATWDDDTGTLTATEPVVGGTGRFVGAEGSLVVRLDVGKDAFIFDGGYITTVGAGR